MLEKDLKVFIGPVEIANIGAILASALEERGIRVTVVRIGMSPFSAGMKYDKVFDSQGLGKLQMILKYLYHLPKLFLQHDVFIFLFGTSLLPYNLDLPILKLFHKKAIMWFLGDDIRHYESLEVAANKAGIKHFVGADRGAGASALKKKLRMIRMVEKYADYVISYPDISQLLTREYCTIFIPMDVCNIRYNNAPNLRPGVVHAPSDEKMKGTSYVLEAAERLKKEGYDFEFYLLRNTSNTEVRETLSEADIAVDQLFADAAGAFAIESMAAGCAVLGGNIPEFSRCPKELPVVHTDPDNVYQNLKMLLDNPELRRELGEKGRKYVEKYHDSRKIASEFVKLLTRNKPGQD